MCSDRQRLLSGDCVCGVQLLRIPRTILFSATEIRQALIGESVLLWFVHCPVLRGVQTAAGINKLATFAKLVPLGLFIVRR